MRKRIIQNSYISLILASVIVSLLATLLADSLKRMTGYYEDHIWEKAHHFPLLFILLPTLGITLIYFLRKYLFKGRQNKGIKEIYKTIDSRRDDLPTFKIPSHYFNGFLTVIFGGSTGIEVSTVVATAAIGAVTHKKSAVAQRYKMELICAGTAAGIATLFGSPIAGFLFAIEVIARKINRSIVVSCLVSVLVSWVLMNLISEGTLFKLRVNDWNMRAMPYFIVLSILAGFAAVYFTRIVLFIKSRFSKIHNNFIRVNLGALLVGLSIFCFPALYGDSYQAIPLFVGKAAMGSFSLVLLLVLLSLVLLKPLAASLTLGAGGDGGVFAPSIVAGGILGIFVALFLNHNFNAHLIVLNFALVGAAAVLSAAIYAPLTALFLTCSIVVGGYNLFIPILIGCFVSRYLAQWICGYTVYNYGNKAPAA